ncbi:MAG: sugar transferase [Armatimonadota bacterium]
MTAKRCFDFLGSLILIIFLAPVMLSASIIAVVVMGRPIIFSQQRPGKNEKLFTLYKFRTMNNDVDKQGNLLSDEQRITKFGRFLRKTSIDELPQLFCVLRGDISLVGPRPLLIDYLALYSREQHRRHDVLPGITGFAQVNGRNGLTWEEKFSMDVWYVDHRTFWLDMKILLLTVWKVIKQENTSPADSETVSPFAGSGKSTT